MLKEDRKRNRWRARSAVLAAALLLNGGAAAAWALPTVDEPAATESGDGAAGDAQGDSKHDGESTDPSAVESEGQGAGDASANTVGPKAAAPTPDAASPLNIALEQKDGTPQWNWQDDSETNGVIRTNDLITYTVQLTANGRQEDTTVTFELPQGAILNQIPGFCNPGSTLTPAAKDIPEPRIPLTADSWKEIPQQTLVCELGDLGSENAGLDTKFDVTVKVRSEVPDGTVLPAVASVTTIEQSDPIESNEVQATVAAAPQYDISKNAYAVLPNDGSDANNGPIEAKTATVDPCSFDSSQRCQSIVYPLWISIPAGGKGNSPATEFVFTDDLRPDSFFGPGTTSDPDWKPEYAPRLTVTQWNPQEVNNEKRSNNTYDNSVRNSGTVSVQGDPGGVYTITLKDGDYTAWTYPNQNRVGTPLPDQQQAAVVSLGVKIEFPYEAISKLGTMQGENFLLETMNRYRDFTVTDVTGQPNRTGAEEPRNNNRGTVLSVKPGGNGFTFQKSFGAGQERDALNRIGMVPGQTSAGSGDGVVARGQVVRSNLSITNNSDPSSASSQANMVACDIWNPDQFNIAPGNWPASGYGFASWPSNGQAVWVSQKVEGVPPELNRVQYGVLSFTPDPATNGGIDPTITGGCDDARITWYDSIAAAGGEEQVGAVRMELTVPRTMSKIDGGTVAIALRATDEVRETGTVMPNYANVSNLFTAKGQDPSMAEILASPDKRTSSYNGDQHAGVLGDRLLAAELYSSINKQIQDPADLHWTDDLQAFSGGQQATFRLIPSISSTSPVAKSKQVLVEDCIPKGFKLEDSNREYTTIRPADANLECRSGETYVRWDLGEVSAADSMNDLLLPIEYTVSVSKLLTPGVYENVAQVTAEGDPAALDPAEYKRVTDKQQILIQSLRGVFLEKASLTPVTQINLDGQGTDERTSWEVRVGNMDTQGPSEMDVIDRLPVQTGTTGNDFDGAMTFVGAEITDYGASDPDQSRSTLYYTTAASFDLDPRAASNTQADGSVTAIWSATPPADLTEVTGVRMVRTGAFDPREQLAFRIDMAGVGNAGDDTYRNAVQAVAHQGLGGLMVATGESRVVESTIGNFFWFDENGNGVQDSGEAGVPNATVRLTGTDDLGNPVELETTTDAAGHYAFTVRSSDANGYTVTFEIPEALDGYEFTGTRVGDDRAVDSDADGKGVVESVVIGADASNLTIDAGIVKSEIDLVKTATPTSGVDAGDVVTYTFTTTNAGQTVLHDVALAEEAFTNADGTSLTLDAPPALDPDASTGTPDELAPGEKLVWTAQYTITPEDLGGPIVNEAKTTGVSPRDNEVEDDDAQTVTPKGVGAFTYSKVSEAESGTEVLPGDTIEYTVQVKHNGEGRVDGASITDDLSAVLDDADYNGDVDASAGTARIEDGVLTWTGDLSGGDVVTITYSVKVKSGGDELLHNAVTTDDERGQCDDATGCETDHRITPGSFTFSKTSDPASGSKVAVDGVVKYTVTVKHDGAGAVKDATLTDDLSKVLDDAEYQHDVRASEGKAVIDGSTLTWTGDLADGAEATITYSVKVKSGGDEILHNTVTTSDERGECDLEVGCETTHTMGPGMFVYSKSSNPKSGSTVSVGDEITYTLTVEHRGDGKVENASLTDDLAEVLDDADYNNDVKASGGDARVKDGVLTWHGDLSHGDTVTITYSVTAKQGGDRTLTNGVTSQDSRGACDPEGQCETTHEVPPGDGLAHTGAGREMLWIGGAAITMLLLGGGLLLAQRRRRSRTE